MDDGQGRMRAFEGDEQLADLQKQYPKFGATFQEGEIIEIKGSRFEISKIIQNGLKLKLLER